MDALLYKYHELAKQSIFFPELSLLNDPMENFLNTFWSGDRTVWNNLFKHYVVYIDNAFVSIQHDFDVSGNDCELPVFLKRYFEGAHGAIHKKICDRAFQKTSQRPYYNKLIVFLSSSLRKVQKSELIFYLTLMNQFIIDDFLDASVEFGYIEENHHKQYVVSEECVSGIIGEIAKKQEDELSRIIESLIKTDIYHELKHCVGVHKGKIAKDAEFLFMDLPKKFTQSLEKLLYPKWSVACFMENIENPTSWSHYADGHRGACLIFNVSHEGIYNKLSLRFPEYHGKKVKFTHSDSVFYKIKYQNQYPCIDFFRNMGTLPAPTILENWYTDDLGNGSSYVEDLFEDREAWHKKHWDMYIESILTKSEVWSRENEYRLIIDEDTMSYKDRSRTFRYKFTSLKGIIFGMNTRSEDKASIAEIITRKCKKHKLHNFLFYQSYYDVKMGKMDYFRLNFSIK